MNIFLKVSILPILLITPFTLNSTDVFHSSKGLVKIQANLNTHIIPGDAKLGNTVLLVTAPVALENIHIVTDCEQRETVLYKKSRSDNQMIYVIQLSFPTSCDKENIRIGDKENIFTDTLFVLPLESRSKMEDAFMNTSSTELLPIMREENKEASGKTGDDIVKKLDYLVTLYKNLYTNQSSTTARDVLYDREDIKYSSPVAGYKIPMKDNIIP